MNLIENEHKKQDLVLAKEKLKKARGCVDEGRDYIDKLKEKSGVVNKDLKLAEDKLDLMKEIFIKITKMRIDTLDFILDILKNLLSISFAGFVAISSIDILSKSIQYLTLLIALGCFILIIVCLYERKNRVCDIEKYYYDIFKDYSKEQENILNGVKKNSEEISDMIAKTEKIRDESGTYMDDAKVILAKYVKK